jgi:hypothetical protein
MVGGRTRVIVEPSAPPRRKRRLALSGIAPLLELSEHRRGSRAARLSRREDRDDRSRRAIATLPPLLGQFADLVGQATRIS